MQTQPKPLTPLEERVVGYASEIDHLAELCVYTEYDPDLGAVTPHFRPRLDVMHVVKRILDL